MPKGFLVKRTKHSGSISHRVRHFSDDERSESGSDQELVHTNFGSPDSGYSASPKSVNFRDRFGQCSEFIGFRSPLSSPLTVSTTNYPSPLYYATFDRLTVYSPSEQLKTPEKLEQTNDSKDEDLSNHPKMSASPIPLISKPKPKSTGQVSPNKRRGNSENSENKVKTPKKPKAARKINFDEDTSSPVSGTIIRSLTDGAEGARIICGDIDSKFNCVEVTPEAKAEIAKIENKIGDYICRLCKEIYPDAFQLAQHRCSMIINVEYRCPECEKVFNCPANLASHRRWHKPRPNGANKSSTPAKILPAISSPSITSIPSPAITPIPSSAISVTATKSQPANTSKTSLSSNISSTVTNADGMSPSTPAEIPVKVSSSVPSSSEPQYSCHSCSKKFRRQSYLRKHQQSHVTDAIFVCQYCSKIFPNDNARAKHEMTHNGGKELTCTLCNVSFPNKIVLEKHVRHHGSDTFNCKYCDSSFCSSPGLTRHINKCHPSENRQVILLQIPASRTC